MEGIETCQLERLPQCYLRVSVGAPTWRGLKLISFHYSASISAVSVGAPTWRGLKLTNTVIAGTGIVCQ